LIAVAEEHARNAGCDTVRLYTNEHMTENIEFYKKLGFEETERGVEQGYRRVYMRKPVRSDGSATASEAREALLFDLDGTLCDPREGIVRCLKYALEQLEQSIPTEDQLARYIGPPLYDSFRALLSSSDAELIERAVGLYRKRFVSKGMFENRVYAGIADALGALQTEGYRLYVVTSKPTVFARRIIDYFGLQPFFQNIYGSELDGTRAGKDELIAHVLAREEIPANNAVMIGDREHDIKGALANGVRPVGVLWGYGSREELNRAGASVLCETPEFLAKHLSPGPSARKKHS
jgi:phosphoglycolate phosphatase